MVSDPYQYKVEELQYPHHVTITQPDILIIISVCDRANHNRYTKVISMCENSHTPKIAPLAISTIICTARLYTRMKTIPSKIRRIIPCINLGITEMQRGTTNHNVKAFNKPKSRITPKSVSYRI